MRWLFVVIVGCLSVFAWGTPLSRVELRERSMVRGTQFTLGEIATFVGVGEDVRTKLAGVLVGTSPLPGVQRTVTREQVITRLRQHGFRPEAFELVGPDKVIVQREIHTLDANTVIEAAISKLRQTVALPEDTHIVNDVPLRNIALPTPEARVVVGQPRDLGGGLFSVPATVSCGSGAPIVVAVRLRVTLWREVVVARRLIQTGEAIANDAVSLERCSLGLDVDDVLTDPAEAVGKTARRLIGAGQPLRRSVLDEPALIRRGQNVKLQVTLDGAVIETNAVALQDGKKGARIRVQVTDTRKALLATVVDGETVTVAVK